MYLIRTYVLESIDKHICFFQKLQLPIIIYELDFVYLRFVFNLLVVRRGIQDDFIKLS